MGLPRRGRYHELISLAKEHEQGAGFDQRASALDHELEHAREVGLASYGARERGGGLESADRPLEFAASSLDALVEASVFDRDRHPFRQHDKRFLVEFVELAVLLLGQVDVAPGLATDQNGRSQEGGHRRVRVREPVAAHVLADVAQTEWLWLADQLAEDAPSAWQVADRPVRLVVDPRGQEPLQLLPSGVEDPDRRVACPRQLARNLEHMTQQRLAVELRYERAAHIQ